MTKYNRGHSGLSKVVSLTLVMAMGARATRGADLTLYGSETYTDAIVVRVTPKQTLIWVDDRQRALDTTNLWGKSRETYANPDLFKLPSKLKLANGTVLKSPQVQAYDQTGVWVWDGRAQRCCAYADLPAEISARYPFTDATRAEYHAQYLKFQEMGRVAAAQQAAQEQAAAAARVQAAREAAQAQARARADAAADAARSEDAASTIRTVGTIAVVGLLAAALLGGNDSSPGDSDAAAQEQADHNRFANDINQRNRERYEKEDQERRDAATRQWQEQKAREQQELMSRPRY